MVTLGWITLWGLLLLQSKRLLSRLLLQFSTNEQKRMTILQERLHKNFVFVEKKKIQFMAYLIFGFFIVMALIFWSTFLLFSSIALFFLFPYVYISIFETIRRKRFEKQLLLFIPSFSTLLKSGHGLEKCFQQLKNSSSSPLSDELGLVLKEVQLGAPLVDALLKLSKRFPSENMSMFVHAISISRKLGTQLSEVVDHISKNVLEKEKLRQHVLSLTSQGKLQAWMAAAMPFMMALALEMISPHYLQPLFTTLTGKYCLLYCFFSMTFGLLWIYKISHKEYL